MVLLINVSLAHCILSNYQLSLTGYFLKQNNAQILATEILS